MPEGILARGKKTVVRWFQREDVDKRQRWAKHSDPLYSHNDHHSMSPRERDLWFQERSSSGGYRMFAVDDLQGNLVGWITLRSVNVTAGTSVLGIALDPPKMGMGYGTDALWAFLGYYFGSASFREMRLDVAAFNLRGLRSYEKCGFHYVGQHWTEHPGYLFPAVFSEARYREVRPYFRRSLLGVEVLYRDMLVDRAGYLRRRAALERAEQQKEQEPEELPARRAARG